MWHASTATNGRKNNKVVFKRHENCSSQKEVAKTSARLDPVETCCDLHVKASLQVIQVNIKIWQNTK